MLGTKIDTLENKKKYIRMSKPKGRVFEKNK